SGLKILGPALAGIFAVLCVGGSYGGGHALQVNQSPGVVRGTIPTLAEHGYLYGILMSFAVGLVIIGGIKRIGATAEKIVPLMCGVYVAACLVIIFMNAGQVPTAFGRIFTEAFSPEAIGGGMLGVLII